MSSSFHADIVDTHVSHIWHGITIHLPRKKVWSVGERIKAVSFPSRNETLQNNSPIKLFVLLHKPEKQFQSDHGDDLLIFIKSRL